MPYLVESNEWRLLQGLGCWLDQRKARYHVQPGPFKDHNGVHFNAEIFEVELRRAFTVQEFPRNLSPTEFEQCQAKLNSLCTSLDDLAWPQSARIGPEGQAYPRLRALAGFLESTSEVVDLASGPNETLFRLPHDPAQLRDCLRVVTEWNDTLSRLLAPPMQEPAIRSLQRQQQKKGTWKKARIRNRATFVLGTLFEYFRCGTPHEVLLKLKLELWQEARCDSVNLGETSISSIPDICTDLRQHTGKGKALMLLIEKYGLFGAWSGPTSSGPGSPSKESLNQLIVKGSFRRLNLKPFNEASPAGINTQDKRALAVKLGFCLMDFFDADITSKRIYFLDFSKPGPKKEFPYLAFGSKLPVTPDSYNFRMGHPSLLSFAKLLLEIDLGENIALDISPHSSQNQAAWTQLFDFVDHLEVEESNSYLQAIRGCLVVHCKIARALRSRDIEGKDADWIIRKILYKEIVHKLELGLAESIPRPAHKRQRSESPPPHDRWDGAQAASSSKMAIRSVNAERTAPGYKRQKWTPSAVSKLTHGETSGMFDDNTPAKCPADSFQFAVINNVDDKEDDPFAIGTSSPEPMFPATNPRIMSCPRPSRRYDFEVAIICALPLEYDAVCYIFDGFWDKNGDQYGRARGDPNCYTTGRVGKYNAVLAILPHMGKTNAASAAASMRSSYGGLRLVLLVGVCGAIPHVRDDEVLLGDVVISKYVFQYDFGRHYPDKFVCKNTVEDNLSRPNKDIRNLVATFETDRGLDQLEQRTAHFLRQLQADVAQTRRRGKYDYPGMAEDKLFEPTYRHKHHVSPTCICRDCFSDSDPICDGALSSSCTDLGCDDEHLIARKRLQAQRQSERDGGDTTPQPVVHVGAVASGDKVMKSAADRDRLSREVGVITFEMEGAGVWDEVPCIVVKGVCDYADSHKHKGWQNFAAATAAAASKPILERYGRTDKL